MIYVAPYAGAWIEIPAWCYWSTPQKSLPTRERGLKLAHGSLVQKRFGVAPYAGAWIEIAHMEGDNEKFLSLPTQERGLKFQCSDILLCLFDVAPYAGAWIEILVRSCRFRQQEGRSLRGSVDWNVSQSQRWYNSAMSLPTRERGLKSRPSRIWQLPRRRRSLRGSVDWNKIVV